MKYSVLLIPIISLIISQAIVMDLVRFRFQYKKLLVVLGIQFVIQAIVNGSLLLIAGLDIMLNYMLLPFIFR